MNDKRCEICGSGAVVGEVLDAQAEGSAAYVCEQHDFSSGCCICGAPIASLPGIYTGPPLCPRHRPWSGEEGSA